MKSIASTLFLLLFSLVFVSCSDDGNVIAPVVSETFTDLHAAQSLDVTTNPPTASGEYVKFSFSENAIVTGDNWDVAFRGTSILVNGGSSTASDQPTRTGNASAYIEDATFAEVTNVEISNLIQDGTNALAIPTGSGNGWYNYAGPPSHMITPIAGKILVFRTHDGKYAKMEILTYYQDGQTPMPGTNDQYYTFNFTYQPNSGLLSFE